MYTIAIWKWQQNSLQMKTGNLSVSITKESWHNLWDPTVPFQLAAMAEGCPAVVSFSSHQGCHFSFTPCWPWGNLFHTPPTFHRLFRNNWKQLLAYLVAAEKGTWVLPQSGQSTVVDAQPLTQCLVTMCNLGSLFWNECTTCVLWPPQPKKRNNSFSINGRKAFRNMGKSAKNTTAAH